VWPDEPFEEMDSTLAVQQVDMLSTHYIDVFLLMSAEYFFARLTTNAYTNSEYVWFIHLYVVNYPSSFLLC